MDGMPYWVVSCDDYGAIASTSKALRWASPADHPCPSMADPRTIGPRAELRSGILSRRRVVLDFWFLRPGAV